MEQENNQLKQQLQVLEDLNQQLSDQLLQLSNQNTNINHQQIQESLKVQQLTLRLQNEHEILKNYKSKISEKDLEIANLIKVFDSYQAQVVNLDNYLYLCLELKKEDLMNKFGQFEVEQLNLMHDAEILNQYRKQKKIKVQKELQEITLNKIVAQTQIQTMEMQEKMMIEKYAKLLNINAQDQQKQQ